MKAATSSPPTVVRSYVPVLLCPIGSPLSVAGPFPEGLLVTNAFLSPQSSNELFTSVAALVKDPFLAVYSRVAPGAHQSPTRFVAVWTRRRDVEHSVCSTEAEARIGESVGSDAGLDCRRSHESARHDPAGTSEVGHGVIGGSRDSTGMRTMSHGLPKYRQRSSFAGRDASETAQRPRAPRAIARFSVVIDRSAGRDRVARGLPLEPARACRSSSEHGQRSETGVLAAGRPAQGAKLENVPVEMERVQDVARLVAAGEREDLVDREVDRVEHEPDPIVAHRRHEPPGRVARPLNLGRVVGPCARWRGHKPD